jgi:hypothetical protein
MKRGTEQSAHRWVRVSGSGQRLRVWCISTGPSGQWFVSSVSRGRFDHDAGMGEYSGTVRPGLLLLAWNLVYSGILALVVWVAASGLVEERTLLWGILLVSFAVMSPYLVVGAWRANCRLVRHTAEAIRSVV